MNYKGVVFPMCCCAAGDLVHCCVVEVSYWSREEVYSAKGFCEDVEEYIEKGVVIRVVNMVYDILLLDASLYLTKCY